MCNIQRNFPRSSKMGSTIPSSFQDHMVDRQHVTQSQPTLCAADSEKTIGLSRITTAPAAIRSSDEKQASSDWRQKLNQSPLFPAVLLVAAGCGVAFQSGMILQRPYFLCILSSNISKGWMPPCETWEAARFRRSWTLPLDFRQASWSLY